MNKRECRSRGLWVDERYRKQGISKIILGLSIDKAKNTGCEILWTMPRMGSLEAYESVGFIQSTGWFDNENEIYGPNCYAVIALKGIDYYVKKSKEISKLRRNFFEEHIKYMRLNNNSLQEHRGMMEDLSIMEDEL